MYKSPLNTTIHILAENCTLREILNNINSGLYDINNYDNIRIYSHNKPDFIILCVEAEIGNTLINFFDKESINFETTYNDYVVISINEETNLSNSISLFELILSSELLTIEETQKWKLDSNEFYCEEINYIEKNEINFKETDMKILG